MERVKDARRQNCTKPNLHEGEKLHEDDFAPRVSFARVKKTEKKLKHNLINKEKKNCPRARVRGNSNIKYKKITYKNDYKTKILK